MSGHENLATTTAVFLDVLVSPSHGSCSIVEDIIDGSLRQQAIIGGNHYQATVLQSLVYVFVATFNATTVKPHHHGRVLLIDGIIDIKLAALLSIGIGGGCVGDVVHLLILLTLCQRDHRQQHK